MALTNEEIKTLKSFYHLHKEVDVMELVEDYMTPIIEKDPLRFDGETILNIYKLAGLQ